ncbi:hypothetical protein D3C87_1363350 [compost metagenome]
MGANVTDATAQTGLLGQITPCGLLVALPGDVLAQPALWILDDHLAHRADHAAAHHLPRLPDHRVTQVSVGQAVKTIAALDHLFQGQQLA